MHGHILRFQEGRQEPWEGRRAKQDLVKGLLVLLQGLDVTLKAMGRPQKGFCWRRWPDCFGRLSPPTTAARQRS